MRRRARLAGTRRARADDGFPPRGAPFADSSRPCGDVVRRLHFFFFNDAATTEIYTLSLHDALPISIPSAIARKLAPTASSSVVRPPASRRSEEHTSELQSLAYLVCRLLLEKKN